MTPPKIAYVQYTNPAAYPPLEQGAMQLADDGCSVVFLGARSRAVAAMQLPPHPRITCDLFDGDATSGWRLKWHFLRFTAWAVRRARRERPDWVYASDIMAAPAAWILSAICGMRVIYHEHDRFDPVGASIFMRACLAARRRLAHAAVTNVLPSDGRMARFCADTGVTPDRCVRVWNCPSTLYVRPAPAPAKPRGMRVLFYGSISASRVPLPLLHALAKLPDVSLRVIGFESGDSVGYLDRLRREAAALGVADRLETLGPMSHAALFPLADECDVGLACVPARSADSNMQSMAGASNKAFEYLARGLPLLVSPLPDWQEMFVAPGYAIACDIDDAASVEKALRWYLEDPARRQSMGERGRERVRGDWNYETQFAPIRRLVLAAAPAGADARS